MNPQISIAIPTKNRPLSLEKNINCCLQQSFQDFEIVISDNSDNEDTKKIVDKYHDNRIKYFKVSKLSMPDNWDNALCMCNGNLLFPIGDKILLHPNALQSILFSKSIFSSAEVISFKHISSQKQFNKIKKKDYKLIEFNNILNSIKAGDISKFNEYGLRGYSLIITKHLYSYLHNTYKKVCIPFAPDFTLSFMAALHASHFIYIDKPLFMYDQYSSSNGAQSMYDDPNSINFFKEIGLPFELTYEYVPLKIYSVWNSVINDFFRVVKVTKGNIDDINIDIIPYWKDRFREILHIQNFFHVDKSKDFITMYNFLQEKNIFLNSDILEFLKQNDISNKKVTFTTILTKIKNILG